MRETDRLIKEATLWAVDYVETWEELVDDVAGETKLSKELVSLIIPHVLKEKYGDFPESLDEMLHSYDYNCWNSDHRNNMWLHDEDRADRMADWAEDGGDGSTHDEAIQDMRDYLKDADLPEYIKEKISVEIDSVEEWHEQNGSLNDIIG